MLPAPLIPVIVAGLAGLVFWKVRSGKGMTPERKMIYENAMNEVTDPDKLQSLSEAFAKEGLNDQAKMLAERANLRRLPEETKVMMRDTFKKGMASTNAEAVENLSKVFLSKGATGAAQTLNKYAIGLKSTAPAKKLTI
jgi:hypothetical protein